MIKYCLENGKIGQKGLVRESVTGLEKMIFTSKFMRMTFHLVEIMI